MAEHCGICDTRRPSGGTKMLILNNGALWLEFCQRCSTQTVTNADTGETITLEALYNRSQEDPKEN